MQQVKEVLHGVRLVSQDNFIPVGSHESGLDISAVQTLAQPDGATKLLIQSLTQNVRYTIDNSDPYVTGTMHGFQFKAGDPPGLVYLGYGATFKVIEEAATANLQYQWGR